MGIQQETPAAQNDPQVSPALHLVKTKAPILSEIIKNLLDFTGSVLRNILKIAHYPYH